MLFRVETIDTNDDSQCLEFNDEFAMCAFFASLHPALFSDSLIRCSVRRGRDEDSSELIDRWTAMIIDCCAQCSFVAH